MKHLSLGVTNRDGQEVLVLPNKCLQPRPRRLLKADDEQYELYILGQLQKLGLGEPIGIENPSPNQSRLIFEVPTGWVDSEGLAGQSANQHSDVSIFYVLNEEGKKILKVISFHELKVRTEHFVFIDLDGNSVSLK